MKIRLIPKIIVLLISFFMSNLYAQEFSDFLDIGLGIYEVKSGVEDIFEKNGKKYILDVVELDWYYNYTHYSFNGEVIEYIDDVPKWGEEGETYVFLIEISDENEYIDHESFRIPYEDVRNIHFDENELYFSIAFEDKFDNAAMRYNKGEIEIIYQEEGIYPVKFIVRDSLMFGYTIMFTDSIILDGEIIHKESIGNYSDGTPIPSDQPNVYFCRNWVTNTLVYHQLEINEAETSVQEMEVDDAGNTIYFCENTSAVKIDNIYINYDTTFTAQLDIYILKLSPSGEIIKLNSLRSKYADDFYSNHKLNEDGSYYLNILNRGTDHLIVNDSIVHLNDVPYYTYNFTLKLDKTGTLLWKFPIYYDEGETVKFLNSDSEYIFLGVTFFDDKNKNTEDYQLGDTIYEKEVDERFAYILKLDDKTGELVDKSQKLTTDGKIRIMLGETINGKTTIQIRFRDGFVKLGEIETDYEGNDFYYSYFIVNYAPDELLEVFSAKNDEETLIYPNVTRSGETIQIQSEKQFNTYSIIDNTGTFIKESSLQSNYLILPDNLTQGIHYIRLEESNKTIITQPILIF